MPDDKTPEFKPLENLFYKPLLSDEEIIEAMARAICVADGRDPEAPVDDDCLPLWKVYMPRAASIFAAIRAYEKAKGR